MNSLALGDIDEDGDLDIVADKLLLNDGSGHFAETRPFGFQGFSPSKVVLGDMNGDARLDIVVHYEGLPLAILLNEGPKGFYNGLPDCQNRPTLFAV